MALSLDPSDGGIPVAVIRSKNKRYDGQKLYLDASKLNNNSEFKGADDALKHLGLDFFKRGRRGRAVRRRDIDIMIRALENGDEQAPEFDDIDPTRDALLQRMYDEAKDTLQRKVVDQKEITLPAGSGDFVPLPAPRLTVRERKEGKSSRCTYFVVGPQGAGKSVLVGQIAEEYSDQYPDAKIFLFSQCEHDPALDYLKPTRIALDESLVERPIHPHELHDSLCIFDDVENENSGNKDVVKAVQDLRDNLLVTGRKENVSVISTSHLLCDWSRTKKQLNEADNVIFYPRAGARGQIRRFLGDAYQGLSRVQMDRIFDLPSRWVMFRKVAPQLVLYSGGAYLLH
jgi:hypothetical protein